tara:strand:- start:121 stop:246 length:126 start_codon:yes stop_codon:yes gene_type:complete
VPKKLKNKLRRQAQQKGMTGDQADRYVYGALRKIERRKGRV